MPRALEGVLDRLPRKRRAKIEERYAELVDEIETLSDLRKLARVFKNDVPLSGAGDFGEERVRVASLFPRPWQ